MSSLESVVQTKGAIGLWFGVFLLIVGGISTIAAGFIRKKPILNKDGTTGSDTPSKYPNVPMIVIGVIILLMGIGLAIFTSRSKSLRLFAGIM